MTRRALLLTLIAVALAALGWLVAPSRPPHVVLITVDTLRADRLGCYGSRTAGTPAIDALAAEGFVVDRAVAPLPETRPSHYTLFSSLHPRDHGVLSNASGFVAEHLTLPALYRAAGYATGGFPACSLFNAAAGEALGFSYFAAAGKAELAAHEVVPAALDWLEVHAPVRFFLYLHLVDPHTPHRPHPAEAARLELPLPPAGWPERGLDGVPSEPAPGQAIRDYSSQLYDASVATGDRWFGEVLDALHRLDLTERTIVVFTSDHGEELFDHGRHGHGHEVYDELVRAPLVMRGPGIPTDRRWRTR